VEFAPSGPITRSYVRSPLSSRRLHSSSFQVRAPVPGAAPCFGQAARRGRPQARRIASSASRRSAASRPSAGRLIRKSRYPLHRAPGFAVGGRLRQWSAPLLDGQASAVARGRHAACPAGTVHAARRPGCSLRRAVLAGDDARRHCARNLADDQATRSCWRATAVVGGRVGFLCCSGPLNQGGAIVASLADYEAAYGLAGEVLRETLTDVKKRSGRPCSASRRSLG